MTFLELTIDDARARILAAQGIGSPADSALATVERHGWVRTLGGVDVYLAVRARSPATRRADLDAAVARRDLRVGPAARGCIYLVPRRDAGVALRLAARLATRRDAREHAKAGIETEELDRLGDAVLDALADGPLATTALRRELPDGAVRSLGEVGKTLGLSSTLPPALRRLEFAGRVERLQDGGRLDSERYLWRRTEDSPLDDRPDDAIDTRAAEVYLRAAGLGTVDGFAAWSGLGKRDARAALARLETVEVRVAGLDAPRLALATEGPSPEALDAARSAVAFLPFEDNAITLHGGPAVLVDPAHHDLEVPVWGRGKGSTLGDVRHSTFRPIVAEGRLVGFWEFDPGAERAVVACFERVDQATADRIAEEADRVAAFLRDDLGHGRSFSLDTDAKLAGRVELVRALRTG